MNMKKFFASAMVGSSMMMAASANAVVLDAWQFNSSMFTGGGLTTNIGHLVVSGGRATITQELNAEGQIFVGARFTEFGSLFTLSYTPENSSGAGDFGFPVVLAGGLHSIGFSGLTGTIASITGTSFTFNFDPGVGSIWLNFDADADGPGNANQLATFTIANPSGGTLGNFFGEVLTSGTANILALAQTSLPGVFRDSTGTYLDSAIAAGNLYAALDLTNQVTTPAAPISSAECASIWADAALCSRLVVTSQGKIDLLRVQEIPEPSALALLAIGLLGMGGVARVASKGKQQG